MNEMVTTVSQADATAKPGWQDSPVSGAHGQEDRQNGTGRLVGMWPGCGTTQIERSDVCATNGASRLVRIRRAVGVTTKLRGGKSVSVVSSVVSFVQLTATRVSSDKATKNRVASVTDMERKVRQ